MERPWVGMGSASGFAGLFNERLKGNHDAIGLGIGQEDRTRAVIEEGAL